MHTDTRKNRAVSISTLLSFLAVNKSGGGDDSHHRLAGIVSIGDVVKHRLDRV